MTDDSKLQQDPEAPEGPSKSQRKREMTALQELGEKLLELRPDQQAQLPISVSLQAALTEARRIRKREARRRHLQYIGKLMRQEDMDSLQQAVDGFFAGTEESNRRFHLAERWRDRLIAEDREAITAFIEAYPQTEARHLRNLVHNARKDQAEDKNTGQARKLFRYIKEQIDAGETPET